MDEITEDSCTIDSAMVHMVDNRNDNLALADVLLDLDDEQRLFLKKHIVKSIDQSNVAKFDERESNQASIWCEKIFAAPQTLPDRSQDLARRLFDLMTTKSIKPGTFWAILFGKDTDPPRYLALLKMDDPETYRYRPVGKKKGERRIRLHKLSHTLPHPKIKLDKAAFVIPAGAAGFDYDLRVLDKTLPEEKVADYFTKFLAFHAPQTDREKTQIFVKEVEAWIQAKQHLLPSAISPQRLRGTKRNHLDTSKEISVTKFLQSAFGDHYAKLGPQLRSHLRARGLKDATFTVDEPEWSKHSSKVAYRFVMDDRSVEVRGSFDDVQALVEITEPTRNDPLYHARITAKNLEEVVK